MSERSEEEEEEEEGEVDIIKTHALISLLTRPLIPVQPQHVVSDTPIPGCVKRVQNDEQEVETGE